MVKKTTPTDSLKKPLQATNRRRKVVEGDISPSLTTEDIKAYAVEQSIEAARVSKTTAMKDILSHVKQGDVDALSQTLETLLAGASPDDAAKLRSLC